MPMGLLGASIVAMLVGVAILGVLIARLWMRVMYRVVMIVLTLAAFGALGGVVWLWVAR
jgi:hypothetical protein